MPLCPRHTSLGKPGIRVPSPSPQGTTNQQPPSSSGLQKSRPQPLFRPKSPGPTLRDSESLAPLSPRTQESGPSASPSLAPGSPSFQKPGPHHPGSPDPQPSLFRGRVPAEEGLSGGGRTRKPPRHDVLTSRRSHKGIFHPPLPLPGGVPQVSRSEAGRAAGRGALGIPARGEFLLRPGTRGSR